MASQQKNAGKCIKEIQGYPERVQCLALVESNNNNNFDNFNNVNVWCGSAYGSIAIHDSQSLEPVGRLQTPGRGEDEDMVLSILSVNNNINNNNMSYNNNNNNNNNSNVISNKVWCGSSDGLIHVFDAQSGKCVAQLVGHTGSVNALVQTESKVWSASGDNTIRCWDSKTGKAMAVMTGHTNWVRALVAVGPKLWSGSDDCSLRIWDQETGRMGKVLEGHDGGVMALAWVENTVWSGSADKSIRVWDAQTGVPLRDIRGHTGWVTSFAIRGQFVWSGSGDKTIRVWNSKNGQCMRVISGHTGWVWSLLSVGDHVWSGSGDKSVRVWTAEPEFVAPKTPTRAGSPMRNSSARSSSPSSSFSSPFRKPPPRPISPEVIATPPKQISTSPIDRELSLGRVPAFSFDISSTSLSSSSSPFSGPSLDVHELESPEKEREKEDEEEREEEREEEKEGEEEEEEESVVREERKKAKGRERIQREDSKKKSVRIASPEILSVKYTESDDVSQLREALEKALLTADSHSMARADIQKIKLRLQKELEETKKALSYEKQLRVDAENSKKMLNEQLRELFALVDEFDYGEGQDEFDQGETIYQIETELGKLANFKRKIEQDRANFRDKIEQMEIEREELLDQKLTAEEELVVVSKKLKRMEEEMEKKIEDTRRKIDGEIGRKAEIEDEAERLRLLQEKSEKSQKEYEREISLLKKKLEAETERVHRLTHSLGGDSNFRRSDEGEKTKILEEKVKILEEKRDEYADLETEFADLSRERNYLKSELNVVLSKLRQAEDLSTKLRNELESTNAELELLKDENIQSQLKIKSVETGRQNEEQLKIEVSNYEKNERKYEEALREWRSILDSLRKVDGLPGQSGTVKPRNTSSSSSSSPLSLEQATEEFSKEIKEELIKIHTHYTDRPINELDKRFRSLEEENENLRRQVNGMETAKNELLGLLDEKFENGDQVISELFESKRDAQERLEDVKRKARGETKFRMEMEEQMRWLQIELEKAKRATEAEVRARHTLKAKLESELKEWKARLENELENGMRRLEEEDAAKAELEEDKRNLQAELLEEKRKSKLSSSDLKTKLDMAMDERRQMEEALRESELNAEEAKKIVLNYERARIEDEKVHEAEMRDYKALIEEELAEALKRLADEELRRVELDEEKRALLNELETFKHSWKEESTDMQKRLESEMKMRVTVENSRREIKADLEEARKAARSAEDVQHDLREQVASLITEAENLKRDNGKIDEFKKQSEAKNRRITELEDAISSLQRSFTEDEHAHEKKIETLKTKLALESKLKEDVQAMKGRMEEEMEEIERMAEEEAQKRKRFESENWSLRAEIEEMKRKMIEEGESYLRKLESEGQLRSVLQDANERLQVELDNKFSNTDAESRTRKDLEDINKKLLLQLQETKKNYEERVETLQQNCEAEIRRRALSDEARERLQQEMDQLRQQYEEVRGEAELEQSKMKFQKEIEAKKKTFERRLGETRRRNSISNINNINNSSLENSVDLSSESSMLMGPEEEEQRKKIGSPGVGARFGYFRDDEKRSSPIFKGEEQGYESVSKFAIPSSPSPSPSRPLRSSFSSLPFPSSHHFPSSSTASHSFSSSFSHKQPPRSHSPIMPRSKEDVRASIDMSLKMLEEEGVEQAFDVRVMESGINTTKKLEQSFSLNNTNNNEMEDIQKANQEFHSTLDEFKKKLYMEKEKKKEGERERERGGMMESVGLRGSIDSGGNNNNINSSKQIFQDLEKSKRKLERDLAESKRKVSGLLRGSSSSLS